jgi:hypothetical protein
MRPSRIILSAAVAAVVFYLVAFRACGDDNRRAIRLEESRVVITNMSDAEWSAVEVWLDTWYRAQAPSLAPGQRLDIPLRSFVNGYGQRYEPARRSPSGIVVSAKDQKGQPVKLTWGDGRQGR